MKDRSTSRDHQTIVLDKHHHHLGETSSTSSTSTKSTLDTPSRKLKRGGSSGGSKKKSANKSSSSKHEKGVRNSSNKHKIGKVTLVEALQTKDCNNDTVKSPLVTERPGLVKEEGTPGSCDTLATELSSSQSMEHQDEPQDIDIETEEESEFMNNTPLMTARRKKISPDGFIVEEEEEPGDSEHDFTPSPLRHQDRRVETVHWSI